LADRTEDGVDAHGSGDKNLDLNLATIRYEIDQERKKEGSEETNESRRLLYDDINATRLSFSAYP